MSRGKHQKTSGEFILVAIHTPPQVDVILVATHTLTPQVDVILAAIHTLTPQVDDILAATPTLTPQVDFIF